MLPIQVSTAFTLQTVLLRNHDLWPKLHVPHPEVKLPGYSKTWVCPICRNFFRELTHLCTDVAQGLQSGNYRLSETLTLWYKNEHSSGSQGTEL